MARRSWCHQGLERRGYLINRQGGKCAIDNMRSGRERRERERDPDEDEEVYDTKCIVLNSRDLQPNAFPLYKVQTPVVYRSQVSFSVAPSLSITLILAALTIGVSLDLIRLRHSCRSVFCFTSWEFEVV